MLEGIQWSSLARIVRDQEQAPLGGFRRQLAPPVGAASPLLLLLRSLTGQVVARARWGEVVEVLGAAAKDMMASLEAAFGVQEQELLRGVLKLTSPSLASLVSCSPLHPVLGEATERTYSAACNLLKVGEW